MAIAFCTWIQRHEIGTRGEVEVAGGGSGPPTALSLSLSLNYNGAPPLLAWCSQSPRQFFQAISLSFPFLLSALVWVHGSNEIRNFRLEGKSSKKTKNEFI
ncbi:hypothetical protein PRUPE_3G043700 [Prunus persica]|uniref:Uncharacterized protein n=1 Tax=Prunus persica TaxID=3760 RepID=A0A251PV72_PRUPE|nr:hypothetical protein PRUPE_3G043700 [Prunus persica]